MVSLDHFIREPGQFFFNGAFSRVKFGLCIFRLIDCVFISVCDCEKLFQVVVFILRDYLLFYSSDSDFLVVFIDCNLQLMFFIDEDFRYVLVSDFQPGLFVFLNFFDEVWIHILNLYHFLHRQLLYFLLIPPWKFLNSSYQSTLKQVFRFWIRLSGLPWYLYPFFIFFWISLSVKLRRVLLYFRQQFSKFLFIFSQFLSFLLHQPDFSLDFRTFWVFIFFHNLESVFLVFILPEYRNIRFLIDCLRSLEMRRMCSSLIWFK